MPVSKYFRGHGRAVMQAMTKQYGAKKGKQVFYALANKRKADHGFYGHMEVGKSGKLKGDCS